jgi:hypothetical protein
MQPERSGHRHGWQHHDKHVTPLTGKRRCRLWLCLARKVPSDHEAQLAHTLQIHARQYHTLYWQATGKSSDDGVTQSNQRGVDVRFKHWYNAECRPVGQ